MICAHCGKEVNGYNGTCEVCGQSVIVNAAAGVPNGAGNAMPPKKKGGKWKIIVPVVAAAGVVTAGAITFAPYVNNTIKKLTNSPKQYCQYVLKQNVTESAEVGAGIYDSYVYQKIQSRNDCSYTGELALQLGDGAIDVLEKGFETDDLDGISDIRLNYTQRVKDNQASLEAKLSAGKESIVSAEMIFDRDDYMLYAVVPELNKKYASLSLEEKFDSQQLDRLDEMFNMIDVMADAYPEPKVVQDVQERYLGLLIDQIDDVEESSEKVTIDGISQKFTVLTIQLDEEQAGNMIRAWAEEAAGDDVLKEMYLSSFGEMLAFTGNDTDPEAEWEEFQESLANIDEAVEDINFDGWEYKVDVYVSGTGKVQGMDFSVVNGENDENIETGRVYYAYVTKGNNIAIEGKYESTFGWEPVEVNLSGKGTLALGKLNAEFEVASDDNEVEFRIENADVAGLKQGHIAGDLVFDLKQFKDTLNAIGIKELKDQSLRFSVDMTDKSNKFELRLEDGDEMFAAITMSGKFGDGGTIKIPKDSDTVDVADNADIQEYIDDCDVEGLQEKMEDLGLIDALMNGPSGFDGDTGSVGGTMGYINSSKVASDTMVADSVHTAVLTAMFDPEVVNRKEYIDSENALKTATDITSCPIGDNVILDAAAEILGLNDLSELSDQLRSNGATGRVFVTITGNNSVRVVIEGTDDGSGSEITVE